MLKGAVPILDMGNNTKPYSSPRSNYIDLIGDSPDFCCVSRIRTSPISPEDFIHFNEYYVDTCLGGGELVDLTNTPAFYLLSHQRMKIQGRGYEGYKWNDKHKESKLNGIIFPNCWTYQSQSTSACSQFKDTTQDSVVNHSIHQLCYFDLPNLS